MVAIRVLPPDVVNRIAAGEVIERPASVVKELVENAIDAGATKVSIHVEEGGRKRIKIRDDGCGIARDDLPLAFTSHATSKIDWARPSPDRTSGEEIDSLGLDLLNVGTLGFRGEALPSIASIAEVEVLSRTPDSDCGYRYRPSTEDEPGPQPSAAPPGTTVDVRNIFYNTPARRKFLKTVATEQSRVLELVIRIALGFPRIAFRVEHGARVVLDLPPVEEIRDRIAAVVGEDKARDLVEVRAVTDLPGETGDSAEGPWLRGFVGLPRLYRSDARGQNFFVNGRWVRDRTLSHALREAYQGFQIPGRQPLAYLYLELPGEQVDINVHPQKTEVRFLNTQAIHRGIYHAVRRVLEGVDTGLPTSLESPSGGRVEAIPSRASPARRHGLPTPGRSTGSSSARETELDLFSMPGEPAPGPSSARGAPRPSGAGPTRSPEARGPSESTLPTSRGGPPPAGARRADAFQVLDSFLVTERDGGLVFIDQHALHEKVLYERVLRRLREGSFSSQRLLLPEVVRLPRELAPMIDRLIDRLRPFGFEVEAFGECEVAVQAIPVILDRRPAAELVLEVAAWVRDHPAGDEEAAEGVIGKALRDIAALMACKQAVKAGTRLSAEEIRTLLEESGDATDPRFCPHGRPTAVAIDREELERWFDRK